eukprot:768680-Hanusia_phi.AAC.5
MPVSPYAAAPSAALPFLLLLLVIRNHQVGDDVKSKLCFRHLILQGARGTSGRGGEVREISHPPCGVLVVKGGRDPLRVQELLLREIQKPWEAARRSHLEHSM